MTKRFESALARVLAREGGYSKHGWDPGGRTRFGISERAHPEAWRDGPPSLAQARAIYRTQYWDALRLDEVEGEALANEVFDAAVNCGGGAAVRFLQAAYNLLRPDAWPALVEDGALGPRTLAAANRMTRHSPEWARALLHACDYFQARHYIAAGNRHALRGWFAHRIGGHG